MCSHPCPVTEEGPNLAELVPIIIERPLTLLCGTLLPTLDHVP